MLTTIYPSFSSSVIRSALFISGKTNTDLDHSFPLFLIHIVPIYNFFCFFFTMNKKIRRGIQGRNGLVVS